MRCQQNLDIYLYFGMVQLSPMSQSVAKFVPYLQSNPVFCCRQQCNIVTQYCNIDRLIALHG
jgi:hypothetical protein